MERKKKKVCCALVRTGRWGGEGGGGGVFWKGRCGPTVNSDFRCFYPSDEGKV